MSNEVATGPGRVPMRFMVRQRAVDFDALSDQGFLDAHAGQARIRERIEQCPARTPA